MQNQKEKNKDLLIRGLCSNDMETILSTLEQVKEEGNYQLVPTLIDLLLTSEYEEVKKEAKKILSELKDDNAPAIIIEAIDNERYIPIRQQLLGICWENGLNFSPYLHIFVNLVIHGSYMESFEAMTVIENLEYTITEATANNLLKTLKAASLTASQEKLNFITDLIVIIPQLTEAE